MKKVILFLLNLYSLFTANTQTTSSTFNPTWAAQFQNVINNVTNSGNLKGVSVAIYVPGQGTFIGVGGESHAGVPITPDMQFGIGSNSKLVTAALIMKLQELGMLSLEDPLSNWLPTYPFIDPSITIRQLLNHQSGIYDVSVGLDSILAAVPDSLYTPENGLAAIQPPYFAPGEKFKYSNTNYLLAALIIEAVTGKSFVENLHQYIFDPLDLDSTFLSVYETPNGNVAHGWLDGIDMGIMPMKSAYSLQRGGAGIFSTASEMAQWYDHLFNGSFLSQASLNEITNFEPSSNYGLGIELNSWRTGNILRPNWIHSGEMAGFTSSMGYDVETGSVICILTNDDYSAILIPLITEFFDNAPVAQYDAGIESVISPSTQQCSQTVTPKVQLINFGTVTLTSVVINYRVDEGQVFTYNWNGNLVKDATTTVTLPTIPVSQGSHDFFCYTSNPNGNQEGYTYNDDAAAKFYVNSGATVTLLNEGFEDEQFPPEGWNVNNRIYDWKRSSLSLLSGKGSAAKSNSIDNSGGSYDLELPLLNLSNMNNPVLSFNYAYGYYGEGYDDGLAVLVSTNCGETYQSVFQKSGKHLKTADATDFFYPNDDQWRLKTFNLSAYKKNGVLIKFRAINGNGNQLYLDNVSVIDKTDICSSPTNLDALQITSSSAKLNWQFNSSANNFDVFYKPEGSYTWTLLNVAGNKKWVVINNLLPGTDYDWYIIAKCGLGTSLPSEVSLFTTDAESSIRTAIPLQQNFETIPKTSMLNVYPNPVSGSATISFSISKPEMISLTVYDMTGKLVKTIANKEFNKGIHQIRINTDGMSAGIYILKLQSNGIFQTKKFIVQH